MVEYIYEMVELCKDGKAQGIFFFSALYAFLMALISFIYQFRVNRWPSVEGDLLKEDLQKFAPKSTLTETTYVTDALYTYQVDGKSYQGNKVSTWTMVASHNARFVLEQQMNGIQKLSDGKIKVFYNPNNPKKSVLIRPGLISQLITLLLGSLLMIGYLIKF